MNSCVRRKSSLPSVMHRSACRPSYLATSVTSQPALAPPSPSTAAIASTAVIALSPSSLQDFLHLPRAMPFAQWRGSACFPTAGGPDLSSSRRSWHAPCAYPRQGGGEGQCARRGSGASPRRGRRPDPCVSVELLMGEPPMVGCVATQGLKEAMSMRKAEQEREQCAARDG